MYKVCKITCSFFENVWENVACFFDNVWEKFFEFSIHMMFIIWVFILLTISFTCLVFIFHFLEMLLGIRVHTV